MTVRPAAVSRVTRVRVMDETGAFSEPRDVSIHDGHFADSPAVSAGEEVLDGSGLWLVPGLYDSHTHITWNDFHAVDRAARTEVERERLTRDALVATLRAGVTSARDGGGAPVHLRDSIAAGEVAGPRLQVSVDMITADQSGPQFESAVLAALDAGAQWVKLVATVGIGAPEGSEIESNFTEAEFRFATEAARTYGAGVMVHAWGGAAIDYSIEHGATSLEHGIYLTSTQARKAAQTPITFVPTLTIYQLLLELVDSGALDGISRERVARVVADHSRAVVEAFEAGVTLAIGSDYGTAQQHGTNLREIASLMLAGIPANDALLAATRNGALLFGDSGGGRIAPGYRADAVLLNGNPTDPATFHAPDSVTAVVQYGELVHHVATHSNSPSQHTRSTP
ncbi:MAG: amidohydrolase family protein [Rhodoglobus sp.]